MPENKVQDFTLNWYGQKKNLDTFNFFLDEAKMISRCLAYESKMKIRRKMIRKRKTVFVTAIENMVNMNYVFAVGR